MDETHSASQELRLILEHVALIAHGGALVGFEDESDALTEIRKHTKPFIGNRINSLQRSQPTSGGD